MIYIGTIVCLNFVDKGTKGLLLYWISISIKKLKKKYFKNSVIRASASYRFAQTNIFSPFCFTYPHALDFQEKTNYTA